MNCVDCEKDIHDLQEYYALADHVWDPVANKRENLCIGCFECRLGRKLTPADFIDAPLNWAEGWRKSNRLRDRLGLPSKEEASAYFLQCYRDRIAKHRAMLHDPIPMDPEQSDRDIIKHIYLLDEFSEDV